MQYLGEASFILMPVVLETVGYYNQQHVLSANRANQPVFHQFILEIHALCFLCVEVLKN